MEESISKPQKANGARWVQHKARACKAVITSYHSVITHLENQAKDVTGTEKAKIKGYLKTLKSVSFVLNLLFLKDVLGPLAALSESLQRRSTSFLRAMTNLADFYDRIKMIGTVPPCLPQSPSAAADDGPEVSPGPPHPPDAVVPTNQPDGANDDGPVAKRSAVSVDTCYRGFLKELQIQVDGGMQPTFQKVRLSGQVDVHSFERKMKSSLEKVEQCVRARLQNVHESPHLHPVKLLDTYCWPRTKDALSTFGVDEVTVFVDNYTALVETQGVLYYSYAILLFSIYLLWLIHFCYPNRLLPEISVLCF